MMLIYSRRKLGWIRISAGTAAAAEQDVAVYGRTMPVPTEASAKEVTQRLTPLSQDIQTLPVGGGCCLWLNIISR